MPGEEDQLHRLNPQARQYPQAPQRPARLTAHQHAMRSTNVTVSNMMDDRVQEPAGEADDGGKDLRRRGKGTKLSPHKVMRQLVREQDLAAHACRRAY